LWSYFISVNGGLGLNHDQLFLRCDLGNDLDWCSNQLQTFRPADCNEIISKQKSESIYLESIDSLEDTIRTTEAALAEARDPENPRRGRFSL
jgi:hypothetical protein